jgi:hypothetical protein
MKLLPHTFKWIGVCLFLIGMLVGLIDNGRQEFISGADAGRGDGVKTEFVRLLPEIVSQVAEYVQLLGLLIYILAKNKREDEFAQKLRYESAFIVLVISVLLILIVYIVNPEVRIEPSFLISTQMILYLIVRLFKRQSILEG